MDDSAGIGLPLFRNARSSLSARMLCCLARSSAISASTVVASSLLSLDAPARTRDTRRSLRAIPLPPIGPLPVQLLDRGFEQPDPDDAYVLKGAIGIAVQGARFGESRALCERWNKLRPEEPRSDEVQMMAAAEAVDRGAFSERAAQRVVRLAHEVRLSAGARYAGSSLAAVYGEPDRFGLDMHVHTLPGAAADLNEALANRVVEDDALMAELGLNFVPTFIGTRTYVGDAAATA